MLATRCSGPGPVRVIQQHRGMSAGTAAFFRCGHRVHPRPPRLLGRRVRPCGCHARGHKDRARAKGAMRACVAPCEPCGNQLTDRAGAPRELLTRPAPNLVDRRPSFGYLRFGIGNQGTDPNRRIASAVRRRRGGPRPDHRVRARSCVRLRYSFRAMKSAKGWFS
jgi:hypothetical protein